jgi:pimeloyl-ACP methyl ester carboxylesterase
MPELSLGKHVLRWTERGAGDPVVLVHSSGMSSRQWRRLESELSTTHRVVMPDLLGYGDSTPFPDDDRFHFVLDELALERLVDQLATEAGPVHLVGHSYGAFLALLVAIHRPAIVRSVAVYEPVSFGVLRSTEDEPALRTLRATDESHPFPGSPEAIEAWLEGFIDYWNGPGGWRGLPEAAQQSFRASARKMIGEVRTLGADRTPHQAYATLAMPVLLLGSEVSTLAAGRVLDILAETIPHARRERIAGACHMGPLTHPAQVNALIAAHVRAA